MAEKVIKVSVGRSSEEFTDPEQAVNYAARMVVLGAGAVKVNGKRISLEDLSNSTEAILDGR